MPEIAGFHCVIEQQDAGGLPVVFLHGSGQDENLWLPIAERIAPHAPIIRLRGNIAWEGKYAFFRRRPDLSLDLDDLSRAARELAKLVEALTARFAERRPVMCGYSNGAIVAAAVARDLGQRTQGAVLMRSLSPDASAVFSPLPGYPVLILTGANDERREPGDGDVLADQFRAAGAVVDHHVLDCGHGWDNGGADVYIARQWIDKISDSRPRGHERADCILKNISFQKHQVT